MKKLSLLKLNDANEVLNNKQMKQVLGGHQAFTCYCGFVGGSYEHMTFTVYADSINEALDDAGSQCGGLGATCSGI